MRVNDYTPFGMRSHLSGRLLSIGVVSSAALAARAFVNRIIIGSTAEVNTSFKMYL